MRHMLGAKLDELHGQEFEKFFHRVMSARYDTFFEVGTYGNLGDLGADGLMIHGRKLYACNGPEVAEPTNVAAKIRSDLAKAKEQRDGHFDAFVFVHNNRRGMHPQVTRTLADLQKNHSDLTFENFGRERFYHELCRLERHQIEDLIGPFPAQKVITGVVLDDVLPLLEHLAQERRPTHGLASLPLPSAAKLEYNSFSPDVEHDLRWALKYVPCVETYYSNRLDPNERDDVAATFRDHYLMLTETCDSPDEILHDLVCYILGNESADYVKTLNAKVVLMYFFGECDIFRLPPEDWRPVPEPRRES